MADDLLLNKAAVIERCLARVREQYDKNPSTFPFDYDRQDIAILNILRACQACIDIGQILVRRHRLGVPKSSRDVFRLLREAGIIELELAASLQRMAGFRNIAVHDYQTMEVPIVIQVIEKHLNDFLDFSKAALRHSDVDTGT
jgi:uncharacterized protein YutE (UPF0331/DUF86 family)